MTAPACPTPAKRRFATVGAADAYAHSRQLGIGRILTPYACVCGWLHLTSQPPVPRRAEADPAIVNRLRHEPHEFVTVVEADAAGRLDMPTRIALRSPRVHGRWITALRAIAARLDRQLVERPASDQWRARATVFRHNVATRLVEAEARRPQRAAS